jgi:hypothetical protein
VRRLLLRFLSLLRWFPQTWTAIDREALPCAAVGQDQPYNSWPAQVLVLAAVVLTFEWYWGDRPFFHELFGAAVARHAVLQRYLDLLAFTWWSAAKLLGFLLVPALHIRIAGGRLAEYGIGLRAHRPLSGVPRPGKWVYLALFLIVLPAVILVSFTRSFQQTYPLYRLAGRSWLDFVCWEVQYMATFLTVEFFFRGYLLFGLRPALGSHAIFVMMVPYCMIHALKPAAESLGAIVAGVVLGTLALATGSIWYGVLIHVAVALSMDMLACWQVGGFPPWGRLLPP